MENLKKIWSTTLPSKLISVLQAMHKSLEVRFQVDRIKRTLSPTIRVKQGDLSGPEFFTFFWREWWRHWDLDTIMNIARWEQEKISCSVDGIQKLEVRMFIENNAQNLQPPTANTPMTQLYLSAPKPMLKSIHRYSWSILGPGLHARSYHPFEGSKTE